MVVLAVLLSCSGAKIAVPPVSSADKATTESLNQVVADEVRLRAPAGSTVLTSADISAALANERQRQSFVYDRLSDGRLCLSQPLPSASLVRSDVSISRDGRTIALVALDGGLQVYQRQ